MKHENKLPLIYIEEGETKVENFGNVGLKSLPIIDLIWCKILTVLINFDIFFNYPKTKCWTLL